LGRNAPKANAFVEEDEEFGFHDLLEEEQRWEESTLL